ncbi:hypothetical protein [Sphingobacterium hotanense]|uniref:Terminase small subunit protein n=1 Tax=Sphingobacterium hotanense TaxID=649196 RepID=A0ABT7NQ94_9SPHI|nr:hypothetical protein [Sphingobacterium hotanense]MDM1049402.1 hypothetical protein [Sphingobacterium hotanense]
MANPRELSDEEKKQVLEYVLEEIALSSVSLRKATKSAIGFFKLDNLSPSTVLNWIEAFEKHEQYARAREDRADNIFEEILDIVDCEDHDMGIDEKGNPRVNHDVIQRDRLRVDARKWMLGKMQPKKYGDKLDVTSDGEKLEGGVTIFQLPDNGRD